MTSESEEEYCEETPKTPKTIKNRSSTSSGAAKPTSSIAAQNQALLESYNFSIFDPIKDLKGIKNFSMTITSKRRTGKSVFMKDICHKLKDWYVETYVFSLTSEYQHDLFDYVKEDNVINSFDEGKLEDLWNQQKTKIMKLEKAGMKKEDMPHVLILMDDLISDPRIRKSGILNRFYSAGRHLCFACIFITQYFTSIPPVLRTNVDLAVCFFIENYDSRDAFVRQYLSTKNNRLGMLIFDKITKEPYQALVICNSKVTQNPEDYIKTYTARLKLPKFVMDSKDKGLYNLMKPETKVFDSMPRVKENIVARKKYV